MMQTTPWRIALPSRRLEGADASRPCVQWSVINLDRSPDRLGRMACRLGAMGVGFTRIRAIDGRRLARPLPGVDADLYRRCWGRELHLDEVGCFLSHLRALLALMSSPFSYAMVLEDDALVTPVVVDLVGRLTRADAPDDWDLVKFEAHHAAAGLPIRPLADGFRLCALPARTRGAAAYLVNRTAAEALLRGLLPIRAPYDHAFDRSWALRTRVRAVLPFPVTTARVASTISRGAPAPRKVSSALWRANNKALRLVCALHAWADPDRPFPSGDLEAGLSFDTVKTMLLAQA